jgi:hypothetical protein
MQRRRPEIAPAGGHSRLGLAVGARLAGQGDRLPVHDGHGDGTGAAGGVDGTGTGGDLEERKEERKKGGERLRRKYFLNYGILTGAGVEAGVGALDGVGTTTLMTMLEGGGGGRGVTSGGGTIGGGARGGPGMGGGKKKKNLAVDGGPSSPPVPVGGGVEAGGGVVPPISMGAGGVTGVVVSSPEINISAINMNLKKERKGSHLRSYLGGDADQHLRGGREQRAVRAVEIEIAIELKNSTEGPTRELSEGCEARQQRARPGGPGWQSRPPSRRETDALCSDLQN